MSNHPNRNWRRVMHAAAEAHLASYRWPDGGVQIMTPDDLRALITRAFTTGYEQGRESRSPNTSRAASAE